MEGKASSRPRPTPTLPELRLRLRTTTRHHAVFVRCGRSSSRQASHLANCSLSCPSCHPRLHPGSTKTPPRRSLPAPPRRQRRSYHWRVCLHVPSKPTFAPYSNVLVSSRAYTYSRTEDVTTSSLRINMELSALCMCMPRRPFAYRGRRSPCFVNTRKWIRVLRRSPHGLSRVVLTERYLFPISLLR